MVSIPFGEAMSLFFRDFIGGVVGYPVWWYGKGLKGAALRLWRAHSSYRLSLGVSIWIKNIFVPMYGSNDIGGRIVSFLMRCVMIAIKLFVLAASSVIFAFLFLIYILLPAVALILLAYHAFGGLISYV
ncbi:MAG: hypothetical protein AAB886_00680 [Patescibacteria group bacterium]